MAYPKLSDAPKRVSSASLYLAKMRRSNVHKKRALACPHPRSSRRPMLAPLLYSIAHSPNLTRLDLGGRFIGEKGATQLAEALRGNSSITTLRLARNFIGYRGLRNLLRWIQTSNVVELDLVVFFYLIWLLCFFYGFIFFCR
jgi:hypothetical protein